MLVPTRAPARPQSSSDAGPKDGSSGFREGLALMSPFVPSSERRFEHLRSLRQARRPTHSTRCTECRSGLFEELVRPAKWTGHLVCGYASPRSASISSAAVPEGSARSRPALRRVAGFEWWPNHTRGDELVESARRARCTFTRRDKFRDDAPVGRDSNPFAGFNAPDVAAQVVLERADSYGGHVEL